MYNSYSQLLAANNNNLNIVPDSPIPSTSNDDLSSMVSQEVLDGEEVFIYNTNEMDDESLDNDQKNADDKSKVSDESKVSDDSKISDKNEIVITSNGFKRAASIANAVSTKGAILSATTTLRKTP